MIISNLPINDDIAKKLTYKNDGGATVEISAKDVATVTYVDEQIEGFDADFTTITDDIDRKISSINKSLTTVSEQSEATSNSLTTHTGDKNNPHGVTPEQIGAAPSEHTHSNYVNQNAFSNVVVGSTTIAADSTTDTLTLVAGSNVTITPDATNDKITITATDTVYTHPTSGVSAGTYKSVTVDANGHVTAGSNPTTLAGYGITDAESKGATNTHNTSDSAHSDIRLLITNLTTKVNNFLDVDDTTTDQLSELITLIEANADDIETITSGKVNVTDIINNLTTNVTNKPLSAAQGVALKGLIDTLSGTVSTHTSSTSNPHGVTKAQVGLGNVDNTADANKTVKAAGTLTGLTATVSELNYVDGVTSNIQTQLDAKASTTYVNSLVGDITTLINNL